MRAFRVDLATLCLLLSALASKAEDLEGTACQCASNARVGELLRGDDQVQKCKSGYYCECATSKVVKCWLDGFMFSEPDQACLYFDCEEYLSAASTKEPTTEPESTKEPTTKPESTKEPTAEPESTKEPTAEPESTKEPTTEPESTKEPTAEPESTKEPTTVPESTKEPTTVPESTKEPTAESTTAVPSTATTSVAQVDDECACSDSSRSAELLRGDKEVEKCDAGFYCKCGTRLVERCFLGLKFSQQEQQCWYGVDCASDLSPPTTPTPSSSTTRDPSRVCACAAGARDYELVRGPDQVDRCDAGEYCDCNHGVLMNCPFNFTFDEEDQACTYGFDCSAFLNPTSATPARPSESTTALVSLEGGACACSDPGRRAELLRGQDAVALCERGYFCSCASGEITACPGGIPLMPKYDENSDTCSYLFDCEAFLASEAVALTTAVEATTESSTESGAWSTAMSMPSLLLTLVVVALVASVGVVYAVTIYGRNRRLSRPGSGAFLLVPGMLGPNMAAVSRKRSESVRAVLESKA